jgi:hypothetical protein
MKFIFVNIISLLISTQLLSQSAYWQQKADYTIDVELNTTNHQLKGKQSLMYYNASPDSLHRVFYHLYFNAFQPGSEMDERSRNILDPDRRVRDRIFHLKENEIGFQKIHSLTLNGEPCSFKVVGTILEVALPRAIKPGEKVNFDMEFTSQVPVQIRRSGRHNMEGIEYTMTQWYPKMAMYDKDGWHANPYIGREFYSNFGDYKVNIQAPANYVIGGTGLNTVKNKDNNQKRWQFEAKNVHDFAWAADPDYQHDSLVIEGLTTLHFYYQTDTLAQQWKDIQKDVQRLFEIMSEKFGKYPYPQFSVIQGGDGGMEYPMCTMIRGYGDYKGKLALIAHEAFHNWYYGILASNEFRYPWMDEGFTSYAEEVVLHTLYGESDKGLMANQMRTYTYYASQDWEVPMSTPADFYERNSAYGINSYVKGSLFLHQLNYIVGQSDFEKIMLRYFDEWKFKHPTPWDFLRVAERTSGMELDWYLEQWLYTKHHINYSIDSLDSRKKETFVRLRKLGEMPMPIDIEVELTDGTLHHYYIPIPLTRKAKAPENENTQMLEAWQWTRPVYDFTLPFAQKKINRIEIDATQRMADVDRGDNLWPAKP